MQNTIPWNILRIGLEPDGDSGSINSVVSGLGRMDGIEDAIVVREELVVTYQPHLIDMEAIYGYETDDGVALAPLLRKKHGLFSRFLDRLVAANRKTWGTGPLDCCSLHDDGKKNHR